MTKTTPANDLYVEARPDVFLRVPSRDHAAALLKKRVPPLFEITFATPEQVKKEGSQRIIHWGIHDTPLGRALLAVTAEGICATGFVVTSEAKLIDDFMAKWPRATLIEDVKGTAKLAKAAYGKHPQGLPLFVVGKDFHQAVWKTLLKIPAGTLVRYGDLAAFLDKPRAARAIGNAVGANPVSWLIPCHRVCHANGGLSGFGWGEEMKRDFLAYEH